MDNHIGIYLIKNIKSGLCYVGQSANIQQRWLAHKSLLRTQAQRRNNGLPVYRRVNRTLLHSWMKYGEQSFIFLVLEYCSIDELTEKEALWLDVIKTLCNMPVANHKGPVDNPMRGTQHSPQARAKIGAAFFGIPKSPEHRRKIGEAQRGKVISQEQRTQISTKNKGRIHLSMRGSLNPSKRPEVRLWMSINNPTKRPEVRALISANNSMRRPVRDTITGRIWGTMSECAKELKVSVAAVHAAATKKHRTVRGLVLERA